MQLSFKQPLLLLLLLLFLLLLLSCVPWSRVSTRSALNMLDIIQILAGPAPPLVLIFVLADADPALRGPLLLGLLGFRFLLGWMAFGLGGWLDGGRAVFVALASHVFKGLIIIVGEWV